MNDLGQETMGIDFLKTDSDEIDETGDSDPNPPWLLMNDRR